MHIKELVLIRYTIMKAPTKLNGLLYFGTGKMTGNMIFALVAMQNVTNLKIILSDNLNDNFSNS